jgi:hypothetical protein
MPSLHVAVFTSSDKGVALAAGIRSLPEVRSLTLVTTLHRLRTYRPLAKLRDIYRFEGLPGVLGSAARRVAHPLSPRGRLNPGKLISRLCPGVRHLHFEDLHAEQSLVQLGALGLDLGVLFATYRLGPEVFTLPRLGCVNLHLGKSPEFRGSSPGFYEMFDGVPEVGVTIHRVTEDLDGGPILLQEVFPIDLMPDGDPTAYLQRYQSEVLMPHGFRMMRKALTQIARGEATERPQPPCSVPPRRQATHLLKRELRRRVNHRRSRLPRLLEETAAI